jgi:XTP/dITP diphosphohydrolase
MTLVPGPLLLATTNQKKLAELVRLLSPLGLGLKTLDQVDAAVDVDETGTTFMENAVLKARTQAAAVGLWAIGEDSGLCVPALQGAPGIYSARFAGPQQDDHANNERLLAEMRHLTDDQRAAYYVSTIALADPDGKIYVQGEGSCWGRILKERRGRGGFGYDPLFEISEYHQTFAELGGTVKSCLSHRARALSIFLRKLSRLLGQHRDFMPAHPPG